MHDENNNEADRQDAAKTPYRVLALKYRPQNFSELIGQDALVRTLTNAIETGRIAHAFMLTGVRGVGKTTTARIIAKALNYTGADGTAQPTTGATDDCAICRAISEDRHPDVIEMDAASRTGVDDIREILDGVRYAPTEARYKVYIIDEVHMLSKQAFNALLKTLEEPPPHVKFIFATTEIRKVPITVLSRCQRFDLRRVTIDTLIAHFKAICEKEQVIAQDDALSLIARAADGSVRDGLSILDQAIAMSDEGGVTAEQVKSMLGLGDRSKNLDLLDHILNAKADSALEIMDDIYSVGGDPSILIQDLLDCVHQITRLKAVPELASNKAQGGMPPDETNRMADMAAKLSMPTLGKAWQILLKGLNEVNLAANPQNAAEMVVIRMVYAANLPDPQELARKLSNAEEQQNQRGSSVAGGSAGGSAAAATASNAPAANYAAPASNTTSNTASNATPAQSSGEPVRASGNNRAPSSASSAASSSASAALAYKIEDSEELQNFEHAAPQGNTDVFDYKEPQTLHDVIELLEQANEMVLAGRAYQMLHFVRLERKGDAYILDVRPQENAPRDLLPQMFKTLKSVTGRQWMISPSTAIGEPTLAEQARARSEAFRAEIENHEIIREVFTLFPGAEIIDIEEFKDKK
ncbi:MAG: DNA polymerase III subunit gamma/tau [Alphaproteobacteria bacterium]